MPAIAKIGIFVGLVTAVVYLPACRNEFVLLDDAEYITENPNLDGGLSPQSAKWAFTAVGYAANYHPLAWISHLVDVSAASAKTGKRAEFVSHAHNVALHAANAVLLFLLLCLICDGKVRLELLALLALFWSLHPLRVEVVAWASERKELLSVFWMLVAAIFYCSRAALTRTRLAVSLLAFALALLSKPVAVSFPAVLFAWDWIFRGRPAWKRTAVFAAMSLACAALTMSAQTVAIEAGKDLTLGQRLNAVIGSPVVYLRQTFWPSGLSADYPATIGFDWTNLVLGMIVLAVVASVGVLWLVRRRGRLLGIAAFAVAWVYVGLVPMLGVVKVASQEHSDRYTYWIGCGAMAAAALFLAWASENSKTICERLRALGMDESCDQLRRFFFAALALAVAGFGIVSWRRLPAWRNSESLCRATASVSHGFGYTRGLVKFILEKQGEAGRPEAEWWLRQCVKTEPSPDSYAELAKFLLQKPVNRNLYVGGGDPYCEARMLLKGALSEEPGHKLAKQLMESLEEADKCTKEKR